MVESRPPYKSVLGNDQNTPAQDSQKKSDDLPFAPEVETGRSVGLATADDSFARYNYDNSNNVTLPVGPEDLNRKAVAKIESRGDKTVLTLRDGNKIEVKNPDHAFPYTNVTDIPDF